jgi:putative transposase
LPIRYNPEKHHRRSIRLTGYDYKQSGAYFVTIVTRNRSCVFGDISDGEMVLSDSGRIAQVSWIGLSSRFSAVLLDSFVVMPNHIHGIIIVRAQFIAPASVPHNRTDTAQEGAMNRASTLGEIVRAYKAASTRLIRQTANADFARQRNYYEHIVRTDECLNRIRQYILENLRAGRPTGRIRTLLLQSPKTHGGRKGDILLPTSPERGLGHKNLKRKI